jgi:formylglycine-generating enzyme required for sulfatase activity
MGKYEVSRDMVEKASTAGRLGLSLHPMDFVTGGPRPDMPATGVSWNEAARFVNWLNTSQGFQPAYKFSTQPGDAEYDSNENILLWEAGDAGFNADNPLRNRLARYVLPSAHEWYKAAFYDPFNGVYYDYPTGSDSAPSPVASGFSPNTAVYFSQPGPADIALAGGLSLNGIMGMGGNVYEWEETEFDLVNNSGSSARGDRGGFWLSSVNLSSSVRFGDVPSFEVRNNIGFRVASIPEPGTVLLAALGVAGTLMWRRSLTLSQTIRLAAVLWAALLIPSTVHAVTIETVPVGNPGNAPEMRYNLDQRPEGFGAVPYRYRIDKYEVAAGQYTEFLNAVAVGDTYGLYNEVWRP